MTNCLYCNKKIAMNKAFCSRSCKETYFQLIVIQVPKIFLKRIYVFCSKEEREEEIIQFAQRHKWRLDLLRTKIENEAIKMGYIENSTLEE